MINSYIYLAINVNKVSMINYFVIILIVIIKGENYMIKVAIVDDEQTICDKIKNILLKFDDIRNIYI